VIGPTGVVRVMVATKSVDFRKGAEGLAARVRETMTADPFSEAVYVTIAISSGEAARSELRSSQAFCSANKLSFFRKISYPTNVKKPRRRIVIG
jgi:IS66 Orf2 like protein